MAFTFACPGCRVELQLPDEAAGQSGQCPRCQAVMRIPSSMQPREVVVQSGTAVPVETPAPPPPRPTGPTASERPQPRSRRPRPPLPEGRVGPSWPTMLAIVGALLCAGLLFASVVVLFSVRQSEAPARQAIHGVRLGRLDANRAVLQNGIFQTKSALTRNDPLDPDRLEVNCRCKRFEVELLFGKTYIIEQDSQSFDSLIRIENVNQNLFEDSGQRGFRNASMTFMPQQTDVYIVYATSSGPAVGNFTLTIREPHMQKPFAP